MQVKLADLNEGDEVLYEGCTYNVVDVLASQVYLADVSGAHVWVLQANTPKLERIDYD